jgi:hypothetical protein
LFQDKICSLQPSSTACQQIARNLEVACNYNLHSVDCLLNIKNNQSHLGRITGEESLLAANLLPENVVVLGEIRSAHPPSETVVVIKSNIPNNFIDLKGKTFCHPGFKHDSSFSHYLLQELESKIIDLNNPECLTNVTLLERHIKTVSKFFGDSCRPGPWTQNKTEDQRLQNKYNSLCKLCNNNNCSVDYAQPFNNSLRCLLENDADIAVTSLYEATNFFNSSENNLKYKYLCKNESSSLSPCTWSSKLPDLLISERSTAKYIENYLRNNVKSSINTTIQPISISKDAVEESLKDILKLSGDEKITFLEAGSYKSLKQYVTERTTIPTNETSKQCDRTLKWCTYSDSEQEKCEWLSQAAMNWGIQPVVECRRSEGQDELSCLDDIKKETADIVVASSDYAYISLNKGLTSIAFPETDSRNLSVILAVIKADDSSISSFNDLQGKKACIPLFGGKEHLALVDSTRTLDITDDENCDYGKVLNDFVGQSCAPGVRSSFVKEVTDNVDKDKLCQQCISINITRTATYCNADEVNKYYGSKGAVDCLHDQKGDFAVITKTDIANDTDLRVICKNNTLASRNGIDVDTDCALFVLASSEVVIKTGSMKRNDIKLALYEFETWFGQNIHSPLQLFNKFNDTPDLLFLDSTPGLNFDNDLDYIKNYKDLLRRVRHCNVNGSLTIKCSMFLVFITATVLFIFNELLF